MPVIEQSHFKPNSTVKSIVDRLIVEEWMTNISYEKYYDQCAPISCTYFKTERNGFVFILQKLIGFLGGVAALFGLIIPQAIHFIRRPQNSEPTPRVSRT